MAEKHEWAARMRRFLDTWDYDLICQDDVDKFHAHLSLTLRLRELDDSGQGVPEQSEHEANRPDSQREDRKPVLGLGRSRSGEQPLGRRSHGSIMPHDQVKGEGRLPHPPLPMAVTPPVRFFT